MNQKTRRSIALPVTILIGLAVVFAVLALVGRNLPDPYNQILAVSLGSAIFASGLTFFLIRLSDRG